jgi:DNA-binding NtrC family response regulator
MIFATHRDLRSMVESGKFREDLYYRIVVVEMNLPPLRERTEDIPPLVDHFLGLFAARYKRDKLSVSRDAMRRLVAYEWPGNVRQLEHVLLNAWVLSDDPVLEAEDFDIPDGHGSRPAGELPALPDVPLSGRRPPERIESEHMPEHRPEPPSRSAIAARRQQKETLSKHRRDEKDRILECLQACNWNRVRAAELSGIPRRTFYRRLREYGIQ